MATQNKFYPVIHCIDPYTEGGIGHALRNTRIARDNGADGAFLIGHSLRHQDLFYVYEEVRKQFPGFYLGLNFLDIPKGRKDLLEPYAKKAVKLNALWCDYLPENRPELPEKVQLFGGIAFKYNNPSLTGEGLAWECLQAKSIVDIPTTSGDRTGQPPSLQKLREIHQYLKDTGLPLAVASGVSRNNVEEMLPFVDIFLVASSICDNDPDYGGHEYLVPEKVKQLAKQIHCF